jgi:hypothetical protein
MRCGRPDARERRAFLTCVDQTQAVFGCVARPTRDAGVAADAAPWRVQRLFRAPIRGMFSPCDSAGRMSGSSRRGCSRGCRGRVCRREPRPACGPPGQRRRGRRCSKCCGRVGVLRAYVRPSPVGLRGWSSAARASARLRLASSHGPDRCVHSFGDPRTRLLRLWCAQPAGARPVGAELVRQPRERFAHPVPPGVSAR